MKIIESYLKGKKNDPALCEDGLFISNDFIAVIDGVTSKGDLLIDGRTSGTAAKDIIIDVLKKIPPDIDCHSLFAVLDSALQNGSETLCKSLKRENLLRAVIVIYSRFNNSIWMYGDCLCIVDDILYDNQKIIDELSSEIRSALIRENCLNCDNRDIKHISDEARLAILPILKLQQLFENSDSKFGYAVLNGEGINYNLIRSISLNEKNHSVVFASDGYPRLYNTLNASEEYLNYVLNNDPYCYEIFKSTKGITGEQISFDDRCYVKFEI